MADYQEDTNSPLILVIGSMIGGCLFDLPRTLSKAAAPVQSRAARCDWQGAAACVGQPTYWAMRPGSVPPREASGKRLSRKR